MCIHTYIITDIHTYIHIHIYISNAVVMIITIHVYEIRISKGGSGGLAPQLCTNGSEGGSGGAGPAPPRCFCEP